MNLTIQVKVFNNVKHFHTVCWKFEDIFFTSLTVLRAEAKFSIYSKVQENLFLYCHEFSAFVVAVIN